MATSNLKKPWLILFAFIVFQVFWLVFNLSYIGFDLDNNAWSFILKRQVAPAIGFLVSLAAAMWIFPAFFLKRKFGWLLLVIPLFLLTASKLSIEVSHLVYDVPPETGQIMFTPRISAGTAVKAIRSQAAIPATLYRNALLNSMIYLLLGLGAGYMGDWFIKDRRTRTLEKEKLRAELSLLRYQLNPHFFFNTLNDIYYLAIIRSDKTADAIVKVSGMLRYLLNEKNDWVPLEKEIAYLREFIDLQELRFPDQAVKYREELDPSINQCQVPPLLLMTFVENAFKHGEPGSLKIHLSLRDKILTYQVINKINQVNGKDETTGIGLANLTRRLFLLYAGHHELNIRETGGYYDACLKIELS